ncbi:uncharacterized protein [Venturia canescens]|uniref:uncharacterized protein n=1 Tax=Venturia canescens TaxID=32260 RepID=UPI001C9D4875|nr:uncharacterized protein LOC122417830 [Venturia canescens]
MAVTWFVVLSLCASFVASFDLGPIVRIGQCRMQCLRKHSLDGTCDWYSNRGETVCSECWQNCESVETQWDTTKSICEGAEYLRCPACQTACLYRKTRVEETYLPSSLPAPRKGPVKLADHDVAILLRRVSNGWKESGYFPGSRVPTLRPDTWILAVVEDGVKHYSWEEWTPTLDSLKDGPLVEATLSWLDVQLQLKKQRDLEQKRFNDRVRRFYLEKYGERVLFEWRDSQDTPIPEEVFRRFFFRRQNDEEASQSPGNAESSVETMNSGSVLTKDDQSGDQEAKESYVVSWEPETGGLMGNQVVDSTTAQISLLPGTKYLVRIASNEGPGSFPIEIDTRPVSVKVWRLKKKFEHVSILPAVAAGFSAAILVMGIIFCRILRKGKTVETSEVEV